MVVGVGSIFDWFMMIQLSKVSIKRVDATKGEIANVSSVNPLSNKGLVHFLIQLYIGLLPR